MPVQSVIIEGRGPDSQRRVVEVSADGELYVTGGVGQEGSVTMDTLPVDGAAADVDEPAANVAAVVTYAAAAGLRHVITGMSWSYYGGVPVGRITVQDAGVTVFVGDIADEGCGFFVFPSPKRSAAVNTAMVITLAAAGVAGVTGKLSILNHWRE